MSIQTSLPFPSHLMSYLFTFLDTPTLGRVACSNSRVRELALPFIELKVCDVHNKEFDKDNQNFKKYLKDQPSVTNAVVREALQHFPRVCEIDIEAEVGRSQLTPDILDDIAACRPFLRGFQLITLQGPTFEAFSDEHILKFLRGKTGIRRITLQGCKEFKSPHIIPQLCPHLEELSLDNPSLSDDFVKEVVTHLKGLKRLILRGRNAITNRSIEILQEQPLALTHLELRLYHYPFTQEKIIQLLSTMQNLHGLAIQACHDISDQVIVLICSKNPNLRDLYLFGCKVTKTAIQHLADNVPNLEALHLSECVNYNDLKKEVEQQKSNGRFRYLRSPIIFSDMFWCVGYCKYLEKNGTQENALQRQIAYMLYLRHLRQLQAP